MDKFKGILMIAIPAIFVVISIMALVSIPSSNKALSDVTWVADGKIHAENEGKLVAVEINPSDYGNAVDPDLGLTFDVPMMRRDAQVLTRTLEKMQWTDPTIVKDAKLKDAVFVGQPKDGFVKIADELAIQLPGGRDFTLDNMKITDQALYDKSGMESVNFKSRLWLSQVSNKVTLEFIEKGTDKLNVLQREELFPLEGSQRVTYKIVKPAKDKNLVVVGKQVGDTIEKATDTDAPQGVDEGVANVDEIAGSSNFGTIAGAIVVDLICAIIIFFGVRKLRE